MPSGVKSFVFLLKNKNRGQQTQALLEGHVAHLKSLSNRGHLVICGPFSDNDQAIQIIRASSQDEAIALFKEDPFVKGSYYREFEVHEFVEANDLNNWLMDSDQTKSNLKG